MRDRCRTFWERHNAICSWLLVTVVLLLAYGICEATLQYTKIDNDAPVVFVLAVVAISRVTYHMYYGIAASLVSSFAVNYFFTYPYNYFTLNIAGYPIDFVCFTAVSLMVSLLTYQLRGETEKAVRHEQETVKLYQRNQKLEEKKAAAELAAEKEKMRGNLLRSVSHDLRTPLTAVAGASSILMQDDGKISLQERKKLAADIHEEALWLSQMVENLLSVTRIQEQDSIQLKEREELVEEVLEETVTKFHRRFPQQRVEVQVPAEILMVPMDAMLIEQVLENLLENAVRHAGVKHAIDLSVWRENEKVWFSVRDYGRGIAQEDLPVLFNGGLRHNDATRGMGIGLSACMTIIQAHGGMLMGENHPEGGALFRFWLPVGQYSAEEIICES